MSRRRPAWTIAIAHAGAPSEGDLPDVRRAPFARSAFGRATERRLPRATGVIAALSFGLGLVLASRAPTAAQSSGPSLPTSCSSGQVVVSDSFDRFRCVDRGDFLGLSGCGDGDLVTTRYGGQLRCGSPSSCSTPALLGLDNFGDVECVPRGNGTRIQAGVLPDCPRGASLVSQGGGEWACGRR